MSSAARPGDLRRSTLRRALSRLLMAIFARRLGREERVRILGFSLKITPGVFHPGLFFSSRILGEYIGGLQLQGRSVLDMGTGSGVLALCAARAGAVVTAADVNPASVQCAASNAVENGYGGSIQVLHSDLFAGLPPSVLYDLVVWNPPFYPKEPADAARRAWDAGSDYAVLRRFARDVRPWLSASGVVLLILTSDMDQNRCLAFFEGLRSEAVLRRRRMFETFTIHRLTC